jgi:hypothetical protein
MDRRDFVRILAAAPLVPATRLAGETAPQLKVVTRYAAAGKLGMPGPYPGRVVAVHSEKSVDTETSAANPEVVRAMLSRGMRELTGASSDGEAWRRFFEPKDVVGIKVNCGGHPWVVSDHGLVAEVIRQLGAVGVPPERVYIYERFQNQMDNVNYAPHVPAGVKIVAAESANRRTDNSGYDPATYVEADLFGEEDTRSNMMRLVSEKLTKIINIPNVKDHGATGATGCLKNIAYGSFSNVARTHHEGVSHTKSFVGTLASVEPLRSRTVLQIMDGLRGVWHAGPFARTRRYVFYPKKLFVGTDPVAIDRLLLDIIDEKRKEMGAISIYDRSPRYLKVDDGPARDADPNVNIIIREPGHVQYAASLGLGEADLAKIKVQEIEL